MQNTINKWLITLAAPLLLFGLLPFFWPVYAIEKRDPERPVSLNILLKDQATPIPDAAFDIYNIAPVAETGPFQPWEVYENSGVSFPDTEEVSLWNESALSLYGFILQEDIVPDASAKTDESGMASFTDLKQGLYLVSPASIRYEDHIYQSQPFLICLPDRDEEQWIYQVDSWPKVVEKQKVLDLTVRKVWSPDTSAMDSVQIDLFKDKELQETITLSKDNDWSHTWTDLDGEFIWTASEKKTPSGFESEAKQDGQTITITNKKIQTPQRPQIPLTSNPLLLAVVLIGIGVILFAAASLYKRLSHHD